MINFDTFFLFFLGLGVCLSLYAVFIILNRPVPLLNGKLKVHLTVNELGELEANIPNLKEVVILADRIEEPTGRLFDAVKKNFTSNVKYTFLISKSKYAAERKRFYPIFEALAKSINKNKNGNQKLISMKALQLEWDDYPYVFYRTGDEATSFKTFAYMGTQNKEGIADNYELIPPTVAGKIVKLAMLGVELEHEIRQEELVPFTKIVSLAKTG